MEDIFEIKPKTPIEEAWHKEQKRKQYDIIRIKNPTDTDFYVEYDIDSHQRIAAQSMVDVPYYIAYRYLVHMTDHIITQMSQQKHNEEIDERRKKGFPDYKDKYTENVETYENASYPQLTDQNLRDQVGDQLWIGLVYEFGRDIPPRTVDPRSGEVNLSPAAIKTIEKLAKKRVPEGSTPSSMSQGGINPSGYVPQSAPRTVRPAIPNAPIPQSQPSPFSSMNEKLSVAEITNE